MHRIAFELGPVTVTWYGLLVTAGFLAGLLNARRRAPRAGLSGDTVMDLGFWLMIGAMLGGRLYYVAANWSDYYAHQPMREILMIHHGGLVFHGGLIGAVLAGYLYVRRRGLPFWNLADVLAPGIALGHAIGRVGCWINGCCYGIPTQMPWAIHYPPDYGVPGEGVHPVQLYEAFLDFALFVLLARWFGSRRQTGRIFAWYLALYGLVRFGIEFLRGDSPVRWLPAGLTAAQGVSLLLVAAGLILLAIRRTGGPPALPEEPRQAGAPEAHSRNAQP
ncbi:MAG TPA: prolipoprotein diacylglyceryl transferase [Candidatus Paceibacterota bacterium]|nr:prolipoprotein diacylglyceryl transferase [Verrucomicrobiota bacterium]HOX01682.1 prolipoprotein diacylglyceryl transferase [Verrucomicrobiota bacterium]HRZ44131.1 prolipoprotein diacylglyceryl transferase [Candidatus Paceibacterota bacterium]